MDRRLIGISASPGIVAGPVYVLHWEVPEVPQRIVADDEIDDEIQRFSATLARARERLEFVRRRAASHAGEEEARIFDAQMFILQDSDMINRVDGLIRQNLAAESAFEITMLDWRHHFARHSSPMMRERVGDLADVQIRVLSLLLGLPDHDPVDVPKGANAILVTHDLTPSLTVQLDRDAIAAIATDAGTRVSHVAILARSLGLPAVVGLRDATSRLKT
ncbi:MAG: phosphoenolpyruvate-utilizing N-terminal domain-containing protein, partial [Gemmatimonadaceae bacterium]